MKQHNKLKVKRSNGLGFLEIISLTREGVLRWVFPANYLANTDNLTSNNQLNQETEYIQKQTKVNTKSGPNKQKIHKDLR